MSVIDELSADIEADPWETLSDNRDVLERLVELDTDLSEDAKSALALLEESDQS